MPRIGEAYQKLTACLIGVGSIAEKKLETMGPSEQWTVEAAS